MTDEVESMAARVPMPEIRPDVSLSLAQHRADTVRAELRDVRAALLDLWADVVAWQPNYAEQVRTAARFVDSAVMTLDASVGVLHPSVVPPPPEEADDAAHALIDLRAREQR